MHPCYDRCHLVVVPEKRSPLSYFVMVGLVWILIAVILDYLFIVLLFQAAYYKTDVYVYYALIFLIRSLSECT